MRKAILLIVFLLFVKVDVFATDACDRLVPREASFIGQATMGANLRSYPCTYKSSVLGVSKVGDKYRVISQVDGWYQIKSDSGDIYRIWDKAIKKVSDYTQEVSSPKYKLTFKDKVLINKIVNRFDKVIQEKGTVYKRSLVLKLSNLIEKNNYSLRIETILIEIKNKINNIEIISKSEEVKKDTSVNLTHTYDLKNIDIDRVKATWLSWYNGVRKDMGRRTYTYDSKLEQTALDWSKISKARGEITHKRESGDSYYDYWKITSWFKDRGVVCKNINGGTHTENIGWGQYKCSDGECSDELIDNIRYIFDFYMAEKYESYKAHYESIVHPYFTKIGLGIEIDETSPGYYKYYLTVHYCTELID